jgi:replicative DNA helicase
MEVGKIPPNDVEAEQAVLGSMLLDKDAVINAIEILKPEDFYREENKLIFSAMIALYGRAEPVDMITVKDELVSLGKLDVCGGLEYIADLSDKVPTTANAENYIKIVEEKSMLRSLIKTSNELIDLGYEQTLEVDEIMEKAEKNVFNLIKNRNQKGYTPIKEVLIETFAQIERLYNQKEAITGIPTGFIDLDGKTAGLHGSELILVAARPAMGKTAFALNIATNAATRANVPVAIFSLEMSKEQLVSRILASETMIDSNKLRTGKMEEEDLIKLSEGLRTTFRIRNVHRRYTTEYQ